MLNPSKGATYVIRPGDHFNLVLPDGSMLNVEQTADDFSIVRSNGFVAYTKATNPALIDEDEGQQTTGRG